MARSNLVTGFSKIVLAVMLLALSSCDRPPPAPNLLSCYQSGNLRLKFDKGRMFTNDDSSAEFSLNKRKFGWVISSNFILLRKEPNEYRFVKVNDGPYDWAIPDSSVNVFKVVSQDGVPFYFGKCLIGKQDA